MSAQPHERRIHTRVMLQCTGSLPSRGASRLRGERASDKAGVARKRTGCRSSDASSFVKPRRGSPSPGDGARARALGKVNGVACCTTAQRAVRNCAGGRGVGVAGGRTGCALSDASRRVEPRCNGASPGHLSKRESGHVSRGFCMAQPRDARHEARRAGEPQGACGGRAHRLHVERHIRLRQVASQRAVARRLLREGAVGLRGGRGS